MTFRALTFAGSTIEDFEDALARARQQYRGTHLYRFYRCAPRDEIPETRDDNSRQLTLTGSSLCRQSTGCITLRVPPIDLLCIAFVYQLYVDLRLTGVLTITYTFVRLDIGIDPMKRAISCFLVAAFLSLPLVCQAIVIDGRDWRQLTDTGSFSTAPTWSQVASVCSSTTGVCSGSLGAVSYDGYTWASLADIQHMFDYLIEPGTTNFPTSTSTFQAYNNADIHAAVSLFNSTDVATVGGGSGQVISGWVRDLTSDAQSGYTPYMIDWNNLTLPDAAVLGFSRAINSPNVGGSIGVSGGVWLYTTPVPLPPALGCY